MRRFVLLIFFQMGIEMFQGFIVNARKSDGAINRKAFAEESAVSVREI
jgi:hypothetical protein